MGQKLKTRPMKQPNSASNSSTLSSQPYLPSRRSRSLPSLCPHPVAAARRSRRRRGAWMMSEPRPPPLEPRPRPLLRWRASSPPPACGRRLEAVATISNIPRLPLRCLLRLRPLSPPDSPPLDVLLPYIPASSIADRRPPPQMRGRRLCAA
jgi:hypothetical protein